MDLIRRSLRPEYLILGGIAVAFLLRLLPFFDFIPIWDGRQYAECMLDAVAAGTPRGLNCFGHTTMFYLGLVALPQLVAFASYPGVLLVNGLLGMLAIAAFYALARLLFPEPERRPELLLLTAAFSVWPVFIASAVNLNPDYGLFVFFLLLMLALLRGWEALVVPLGLATVLSKETGAILFIVAAGAHSFLATWLRQASDSSVSSWLAMLPRHLFLAALILTPPVLLLAGYRWSAFTGTGGEKTKIGIGFLLSTFGLQFGWIPVLFIAVWVGRALWRWLRTARAERALWRWSYLENLLNGRYLNLRLALVLAVLVMALCPLVIYPTFNNPRYLLAFIPLFLLAAYAALSGLVASRQLRQGVLASWALLFLLSNFLTVDPMSRLIYGTFAFGEHEMLTMTGVTGECCGRGRDQLAYNLQFTHFHYAQDDFYSSGRPSETTLLIAHPLADWFLAGRIDATTYRRTLSREGSRELAFTEPDEVASLAARADRAYLLNFPNFELGSDARQQIEDSFGPVREGRYGRNGYWLSVEELRPLVAHP